MKIIIVGAGKIGATLAELFASEGHDVTIVDKNQKIVNNLVDKFDVMGVQGNGANSIVLKEAHADKADILISVASTDEINMLTCTIAQKLGVKYTLARIRNPENTEQIGFIYKDLGIDMIVNPEFEAAEEIYRTIRFPSALKLEKFAHGKVEIAEVIITENHPLVGIRLCDLNSHSKVEILICAVKRGDDVIIPDGNFEIHADDIIYIIASHTELLLFFKELDLLKRKIQYVMIIGGSKIAFYLSRMLLKQGISVKIIEIDRERCEELSVLLPKATIVNADGSDGDVLTDEGIELVDACVTLTDMDEENIIISMFASSKKVSKVITKMTRMSLMSMMPQVKIENSVVSPKYLIANNIIRFVRSINNADGENSIETLYKIVDSRVEAIEFKLKENFKAFGIPLKDLKIKPNILIACIKRDTEVIRLNGTTTIEQGDRVIIVTTNDGLTNINDILA